MDAALRIPADVARSALVYIVNGHPPGEALEMAAADVGLLGMIGEEEEYGETFRYPLVTELA